MDTAALRRLIEPALAAWNQPGLGLTVVERESEVFVGGFGARDRERGGAVDGDTVFGIASLAKPFTAATVALLVDDGKLGWDDRVRDHLPEFALYDPWVAEEARIRDLLSMRLGLLRAEHRHRLACTDRTDHLRRMRFHPPVHPFRAEFAYCSEGFIAAAEIVRRLSGQRWEDVVATRLLAPLGMARSGTDHRAARAMANAATPHVFVDGRLRPVEWFYEDHISGPSGGITASPADLARWLRLHLGRGLFEGRRVLSEAAVAEMQTPHTANRGRHADDRFSVVVGRGAGAIRFPSYGLGWYLHDYRGHTVVHHTGSIDGFKAVAGLLPDLGWGAAVLINGPHYHLPLAILQGLIDRRIGAPETDWSERFRAHEDGLARANAKFEADLKARRRAEVPPSAGLDALCGRYTDEGCFGTVAIERRGERLALTAGPLAFDLRHWHGDMFEAHRCWPYPREREFFLNFRVDATGRAIGFDTTQDAAFHRLGEAMGAPRRIGF